MRQVGESELVWKVRYALSRVGAQTRKEYAGSSASRSQGEHCVAMAVVDALRYCEIMIDAPIPEGADLFSHAAYNLPAQPMIHDK